VMFSLIYKFGVRIDLVMYHLMEDKIPKMGVVEVQGSTL